MGCEYVFNGVQSKSYAELIESLENVDISQFTDILFSQASKQDIVYDKINTLKTTSRFVGEEQMIDGGPDVEHDDNTFTTQTFIDAALFQVGDETPMLRLNTEQYVEKMKERYVKDGEMTQEMADQWGDLVQERWDTIAKDALDFHKLILGDSSDSLYEWSTRTANTSFAGITQKIKDAESEIFRYVMLRNGRDHRGTGATGKVIKNLNVSADLKNIAEKILGHIDYLVVRDNGDIEIFNVKTSIEPKTLWARAKQEKYKYQLALLKRILAFNGIGTDHIRLNIIPVQIKYNEQFNAIEDVFVQKPYCANINNEARYVFQKYDDVAAQFIDSKADMSTINNEALLKVTTQLQHIFPGKEVGAQGIQQTAEEWIDRNWKYCKPEVQPDGGYKITFPDTKETITLTDPRRGSKNMEFVNIVRERLSNSTTPMAGELSAYFIRTDLQNSFRNGFFSSTSKGAANDYMQAQFSKYFEKENEHAAGTDEDPFIYKWELIESDTLDAANIIAFRNKATGQMDVFTITGSNPATKYHFKGRDNLLGYYLPDLNKENFELECNYGNIDAIRTVALLNEVLPQVNGTIKLGQLMVINPSNFAAKKGCYFDFDSLLPQWNTVVKVVNGNSKANIVNNFRDKGIQCIAPEEVVRQCWVDITNNNIYRDMADVKALGDVIDQKTLVDGTVVEGLMSMSTIEGKISKLELLVERLKKIADDNGINYNNPERLIATANGNDKRAAIAKLYMTATKALALYYGDVSINNEEFSAFEEYVMKTSSIGNTNVRRVAYLTQKTIDIVRGRIVDEYMPNGMQVFKSYYGEAGYSSTENSLVGDQVRTFKNMYQLDEQGHNTFLFKNPYDPAMAATMTQPEIKFLKNILYEFYKVRQRMKHLPIEFTSAEDPKLQTDMPSNYLYVPLQKASAGTRRMQALSNMGERISQWGKRFHKILAKPKEAFDEMAGYLDDKDTQNRDSAFADLRVYNPYTRSETSIRERDLIVAEKGEGFFETNIENIFVDFLAKQVQCEEFEKLLMRVRGIELGLLLKGIAEGDDKDVNHTIKAIDDYVSTNVYNRSIMDNLSKRIDNFVQPLRRLVSSLYVSANPAGFVRDIIQGLQENFVQAAIKFQTDVSAKDIAFGYSQVFKEGCTSLMSMSLLNQFNIKYGFSNFDAAKVAERLKTGRGGVLNPEHWAYWTLRAPDYLNRMTLFIAKLHKDGAWDAYSLDENHRLKYNWRLDKRFDKLAANDMSDMKVYNEQKALYMSLIRAFNIEGHNLAYTDDLPDAYTPEQIRSIKTLAESIYGAYDESSKAKYENIAIGRNFMFFSTWMNGIVDNYGKRRQISQGELRYEQETDYNGNPLFFTDDISGNMTTEDTGKPVGKWAPVMVQGILETFWSSFKELKNDGWSFKTFKDSDVWKDEVNRRNYRRAMSDLAIAALLAALFKMWLTPAYKEHKANDDGKNFIANVITEIIYKGSASSFDTFSGPAAVLDYIGNSTNPATYKLQTKAVSDLYGWIFGDKTFGQIATGSQAFLRSMQDSYRMYVRDTAQ